jgi:FkbH-like protein
MAARVDEVVGVVAFDAGLRRLGVHPGEGRRRGELYAARQRRLAAAAAFTGSTEDFLRAAGTRVGIAPAVPGDAPRLHELSLRTRQFNSAAQVVTAEEFTGLITGGACEVFTVRLSDAFSDDGMVGGCVVTRGGDGNWTVRLLMMSCRAMGRGVIGALLAWLARAAARAGARALEVPCVLNDRNLPLRLALAGAGFRAASARAPVVFRRGLSGDLLGLADWVSAPGEPGPVAAEIRGILAARSGQDWPEVDFSIRVPGGPVEHW